MTTPPRIVTPSINAAPLVCDEFQRGSGYATWRPRGSGDWLLIYTRGGAGRAQIASGEQVLRTGDVLLFAPGTAQDYATHASTGHWHLRWAHFQPRAPWRLWLRRLNLSAGVALLTLRGRAKSAVDAALGRMIATHRLDGIGGEDLAMNALEEALIWIDRACSGQQHASLDERVQRATHHLATHPHEPFRLDTLARHCGLSPSRLSHLFREELGTTPQRFSEKLRLDLAQRLLARTNLPISEIARETGFEDALYFSRRYRRVFGAPPSAERQPARGAR